jgi:hypothetical protein
VSLDEQISELYRRPLDEFIAARDELTRQLRADGDKDAAARVKALKKPNIAAWALNQLAHRHPDDLDELFDATAKVRDAQRRVMSGRKADLRAATDRRNAVVNKLTKLAQNVLEEGGHAAAGSTMSAVGDSLVAVASDEQGAEALRSGTLSREFKPGAVVDVGVLGLAPSDDEQEEAAEPDEDSDAGRRAALQAARRRVEQTALAADAAEAEARRLADEAEQADRRARSAAEAAEFARRAAEARRAEADEAVEAAERLKE